MTKKLKSKFSAYQIDQSGKIEQTRVDCVICLSNGSTDTIQINAKTKRQIQEIFRRHGQIRNYVLFTFCALISIIIKRNSKLPQITIDKEYLGKEPVIKEILLEMLKASNPIPEIRFSHIGRKVNAHSQAYLTYTKKVKPRKIITLKEVIIEIKKTEVGKRLKNA